MLELLGNNDPMPQGVTLQERINEMGLSRTAFASLIGVKEPTVGNWIKNPHVTPRPELAERAKTVLNKFCRCCGTYTEKENAWDHSTAGRGKGGRLG